MRNGQSNGKNIELETATAQSPWAARFAIFGFELLVLASILSLDGRLGPNSLALKRLITLVVVVPCALKAIIRSAEWRLGRSIVFTAASILVASAPSSAVALAALAFSLALIGLNATPSAVPAPIHGRSAALCLTYIAAGFVVQLAPQVRSVSQAVCDAVWARLRMGQQADAHASFTSLGVPMLALGELYLLWGWRRARGIARPMAAAALPLLWLTLTIALPRDAAASSLAVFRVGATIGSICLMVAVASDAIATTQLRARGQVPARLSLMSASLAAVLAGHCLVGGAPVAEGSGRAIRVHNYGGLDWERPMFGQFGAFSGGMFGLFSVYCRGEGHDLNVIDHRTLGTKDPSRPTGPVASALSATDIANLTKPAVASATPIAAAPASAQRTDRRESTDTNTTIVAAATAKEPPAQVSQKPVEHHADTIERSDLAGIQILVLINSPKEWNAAQRRLVLDFVAGGGSLLILGDHTDVFGLMRGFNTLIGPLGIKFRFDSAYKAAETWRGCQAAAPDLVTWGWEDENPGVAVGASLELSGNARPLLVGRYAFSDAGIRENVMGSFLGNYHYDAGEKLADVVLVATVTHGNGRIVVWGDTSAFQGGFSSNYRKVVGPMLAWLSRPAAWTEKPAVRTAAALGLLAVVVWCWVVAATPKHLALISFSLLMGMLVPWVLSLPNLNPPAHVDRDVFLIDRSHMEATGHYEAKVNPIGPLYTNLFRSGFRVLDMDEWDADAIRRGRGVAFVAPQKSFNSREVDQLLRAEENGAVVILTTGQPDSAGSMPLLAAHGVTLEPRPMGTVTSADPASSRREREQHPRFLDAWPIVTTSGGDPATLPDVDVIYRQGDDVVALFRRMGQGGLLLISDTRFFSDMNVEDMSGYWVGNLALIHDLFNKYLGADPDAVKPLFRSPEKPP